MFRDCEKEDTFNIHSAKAGKYMKQKAAAGRRPGRQPMIIPPAFIPLFIPHLLKKKQHFPHTFQKRFVLLRAINAKEL
jgi:hypothetical protein